MLNKIFARFLRISPLREKYLFIHGAFIFDEMINGTPIMFNLLFAAAITMTIFICKYGSLSMAPVRRNTSI